MDERALITRVLAGDPGAERTLYDAYVDRVFRVAHRITGDADAAQDATQEAFIRAFRRLGEFRGESSLSTWLTAIAISCALTAVRSAKRVRTREVALDEAPPTADPRREADPDLRTRLAAAVEALPEGYRTVFVLHDVEGYTHEEIGAALGVQAGTSKAQLSRARAKLRAALADFAR